MIRKIKALGLAFVAIAALSAVVSSATQAAFFKINAQPSVFTAHSEPSQVHTFGLTSTGGAKVSAKCNTASFEGTVTGQSPHGGSFTPTFEGCSFAGLAAQVQMNGCSFRITGESQPAKTYLLDIVGCTAGKQIQIKTAICTVDIPEQNGLSHLVGATGPDANGIPDVTLEATVAGITMQQTGAACPDGNNHHTKTGTFTGNTIVKAFADKGNATAKKHDHEYAEQICDPLFQYSLSVE